MTKIERIMDSGREFLAALKNLFDKPRFAPTRHNVWSF
jgi:hypothetical protein